MTLTSIDGPVDRPGQSLNYDVPVIADLFGRAARGDDVSFNVSEAISRLQAQTMGRHLREISGAQYDMLSSAIGLARDQIVDLFDTTAEQKLACRAVDGILGVVSLWAGTSAANRADCQSYARWLRNACHNLCLIDEIEARAKDRRAGTVREILEKARSPHTIDPTAGAANGRS